MQGQVSLSAKMARLAVLGGQLDGLIEPGQSLVRLLLRQLDGTDPQGDLEKVGIEFQSTKVSGQRFVGSAQEFQNAAFAHEGLGVMRIQLDCELDPFQSVGILAASSLDLSQTDQGPGVVRIELQGAPKADLCVLELSLN